MEKCATIRGGVFFNATKLLQAVLSVVGLGGLAIGGFFASALVHSWLATYALP